MNLRKTKLYKTVVTGTPEAVMKSLWDYLKSGKDVNMKDEETGGTLLHLLVDYGERFCEPDTIQAIYMMVCKDIEIDAQDEKGDTALHKVMRKKGTYRIMMAIIRFVFCSAMYCLCSFIFGFEQGVFNSNWPGLLGRVTGATRTTKMLDYIRKGAIMAPCAYIFIYVYIYIYCTIDTLQHKSL